MATGGIPLEGIQSSGQQLDPTRTISVSSAGPMRCCPICLTVFHRRPKMRRDGKAPSAEEKVRISMRRPLLPISLQFRPISPAGMVHKSTTIGIVCFCWPHFYLFLYFSFFFVWGGGGFASLEGVSDSIRLRCRPLQSSADSITPTPGLLRLHLQAT